MEPFQCESINYSGNRATERETSPENHVRGRMGKGSRSRHWHRKKSIKTFPVPSRSMSQFTSWIILFSIFFCCLGQKNPRETLSHRFFSNSNDWWLSKCVRGYSAYGLLTIETSIWNMAVKLDVKDFGSRPKQTNGIFVRIINKRFANKPSWIWNC